MKTTIAEIAALIGAQIPEGTPDLAITGVASVSEAEQGDVTFFGNIKYLHALKQSKASVALVPVDFDETIGAIPLRVENPSIAFAAIIQRFSPPPVQFAPGIHPTAVIAGDVKLGEGVSIQAHVVIEQGAAIGAGTILGAGTYIGHHSVLGAGCHLHPNVTIRESCNIGDRVVIHSGTVIGSDGFGYELVDGRHVKIPQVGTVQIDNDVEIGANVTVDRARFGRTWIQEGTKIDNLVQIAHNVTVGPHCILISQTGISGSTRLGHHVITAGQVGIVGHIRIGDCAVVGAKSGVSKDIPAGETWMGIPAIKGREFKERLAYTNRLGLLVERVKKLEQQIAQMAG